MSFRWFFLIMVGVGLIDCFSTKVTLFNVVFMFVMWFISEINTRANEVIANEKIKKNETEE